MEERQSKKLRVKSDSFNEIAKRTHPQRVLNRKYRRKQADGFLRGLKALLGPNHVVIDCGANIGEITCQLAPTGAEIHSFEPDPYSFSRLEGNCSAFENVTLHNKAVGVGSGALTIYRKKGFESDPEWFSLTTSAIVNPKAIDKMEAVEVEFIDLEGFIQEKLDAGRDVAFLKMDIEGGELEILERFVQTDVLTKVRSTAVETHAWLFDDGKKRFSALRKIARKRPDFNLDLDWY